MTPDPMTAPMNEKVPGVERRPATVDTTIAEYVANAAHGSRYGVDWVYHDDRLGYLLTKPIRDPDIFLRTLRQNGGWQPIETAPKDGTYVLGFHPRPFVHGHFLVAAFDPIHEQWTEGGFSSPAPTHWQPLPPSPAASEEPT